MTLKTDLYFQNLHEDFGKFSPEHSEVKQIGLYRDVMCHDSEEWCKVWRGIDLSFQDWHEELDEFWPKHYRLPKWLKYLLLELKKCRGVMFDGNYIDAEFEGKLLVFSKMTWRIWQIFTGWKVAISF